MRCGFGASRSKGYVRSFTRIGRSATVTHAASLWSGKHPPIRTTCVSTVDGGASFRLSFEQHLVPQQVANLFQRCGPGANDDASVGLTQEDFASLDDDLAHARRVGFTADGARGIGHGAEGGVGVERWPSLCRSPKASRHPEELLQSRRCVCGMLLFSVRWQLPV